MGNKKITNKFLDQSDILQKKLFHEIFKFLKELKILLLLL